MTLDHDQIRELLAAHALDAVEGGERDRIDAHLAICAECRIEFDEHRSVAALIGAQAAEVDVPASLWDRVRAEISPASHPVALRRRRASLVLTIGAAAAMLVLVVVQTARLSATQAELVAAESRLATVEQAMAAGDWSAAGRLAADSPGARAVAAA